MFSVDRSVKILEGSMALEAEVRAVEVEISAEAVDDEVIEGADTVGATLPLSQINMPIEIRTTIHTDILEKVLDCMYIRRCYDWHIIA